MIHAQYGITEMANYREKLFEKHVEQFSPKVTVGVDGKEN